MAEGTLTREQFLELPKAQQEEYFKLQMTNRFKNLPDEQKTEVVQKMDEKGLMAQIGEGVLDAFIAVGEELDSISTAPTRAAIGTYLDEAKLATADRTGAALEAFAKQFGDDPQKAPSGKELAGRLGATDKTLSDAFPGAFTETGAGLFKFQKGGWADISGDGAAGLAIDVLADPLNIIPVGAIVKPLTKGTKFLAKGAVKGTTKVGVETAKAGGRMAVSLGDAIAKSDVVSKTAKGITDEVANILNPKRSPHFNKYKAIAEKNGINPDVLTEAIEFGQESVITRGMRKVSEGPTGEKVLKRVERFKEEVNGALHRKIGEIGGGSAMTPVEAGTLIRDSVDNATQRIFDHIDVTYGGIAKQFPDLSLSKDAAAKLNNSLDTMAKEAEKMVKFAVTAERRNQGSEILNAINKLRDSGGNYANLATQMQEIGNAAFKFQNKFSQTPPNVKMMRDLYGAVSKSLVTTTKSLPNGKRIARNLTANNKTLADFFSNKSIITKIAGKDIAPEAVFKSLVTNGDSTKIGALKNLMSTQELQMLKGSYLDNVLGELDGAKFKSMHNKLNKRRSVTENLLNQKEINDLEEILSLGDAGNMPLLGPSGGSLSFQNMTSAIRTGFANEVIIQQLKDKARRGVLTPKKGLPRKTVGGKVPIGKRVKKIREAIPGFTKRELQVRGAGKAAQVLSIEEKNKERDAFLKLPREEQEKKLQDAILRRQAR